MDSSSETIACPYAVLVRLADDRQQKSTIDLHAAASNALQHRDLLLAVVGDRLLLFARPTTSVCGACEANDTTRTLVAMGLHCPHVASYGDYEEVLALPLARVRQVQMTYRTSPGAAATSVATRTRDLVLGLATTDGNADQSDHRLQQQQRLWLEFEHNLARGWFLEALTARVPDVDVDHVDLSDASAVMALASTVDELLAGHRWHRHHRRLPLDEAHGVLRDALRHVTYEKIKLALQISFEASIPIDDPTCGGLLATAMELSGRLDEPDLLAFTWLTSGFINMQALRPTEADKRRALALAQVQHSLAIARENSLQYLTFLALHCAADLHLQRDEPVAAQSLLVEAARLMPGDALEPAMKMQLHRKIHDLRELLVAGGDGKTMVAGPSRPTIQRAHSVAVTSTTAAPGLGNMLLGVAKHQIAAKSSKGAFNLWAHSFGNGNAGGGSRGLGGAPTSPKRALLRRVPKARGGPTRSCFVEALGAHGARVARLRVFFDPGVATFAWLRDHLRERLALHLESGARGLLEPVRIELFFDPQRRQLVPSMDGLLDAWLGPQATNEYALHAKLGLTVVSTHHASVREPMRGPVVVVDETATQLDGSRSPRAPTIANANPNATTFGRASVGESPTIATGPCVTCSLCHRKIPLDIVEEHSETCF